eukprot:UN32338
MADVPLSIASTTASTCCAMFMMPVWIFVYLPSVEGIEVSEILPDLCITLAIIVIATGVGMYLKYKNSPYAYRAEICAAVCSFV